MLIDNLAEVPVLILAGGRGTRLASVVNDRSKVVADISGVPFLSLIIRDFIAQGFSKFFVSTGYKAFTVERALEKLKPPMRNVEITTIYDQDVIGTLNAVAVATVTELELQGGFLLVNGDTAFDPESISLIGDTCVNSNLTVAFGTRRAVDDSRFGKMSYRTLSSGEHRLTAIGKDLTFSSGQNSSGYATHAGSYYVTAKDAVALGGFIGSTQGFETFINANAVEGNVVVEQCIGRFLDIGIPEDLERCKKLYERHGKIFN